MHLFETAKYPGSRRDPLRWLQRNLQFRFLSAPNFDYEAFADSLFNWDYNMGANGHVFRRI